MARLPQPGSDNGTWGTILNDYLSQTLKSDGSLKDNTVTNSAIAPDAITATEIQDGTITETQLATAVQTKLNTTADWNSIANKPTVIGAGASQAAARAAIGAIDTAAVTTALSVVVAPAANGSDDTAVLQALIDAAYNAGGGTIALKSGQIYKVTGLTIKSYVHLNLSGSTIQLVNATTASVIQTESYATLVAGDTTGGPTDWSISNGFLDGNKANQSGTTSTFPAILAIYGRRYVLDNLVVCNGYGTGIDSQWSTTSPFQLPNGFESWITRVYVHSCKYDGINFRGPHDTFMQNFFIVKCGEAAGSVPLRFPDSSGRANGSNVDKFHIYGGNGYNYCVLANTAGIRFSNFVAEGAQIAQILVQASQVMLEGFHLYTGGIQTASAKGLQFGDAAHTGINGLTVRGRVENCGGGVCDVTYLGWNNDIDLHHFYTASTTPTKTDLGYVGTLVVRNKFSLRTTDSGSGSGGTFAPTSVGVQAEIGPLYTARTNSGDTRDLWQLRAEDGTVIARVDWRGRRRVVTSGPIPTIAAGANAGTGATVAITGDDSAGKITVTTGSTGSGIGTLATVTFSGVFGNSPFVVITPKEAAGAGLGIYNATSTSTFSIRCSNAPTASTAYNFDYIVVGA